MGAAKWVDVSDLKDGCSYWAIWKHDSGCKPEIVHIRDGYALSIDMQCEFLHSSAIKMYQNYYGPIEGPPPREAT